MIPITLQPEPSNFDSKVRIPGVQWLRSEGIQLDQPPSDPAALPSYWRRALKELWDAYGGVCAYLCIFFEWSSGAASTDHFVAKSTHAGMAYEWSNYRLSCLGMNRCKNRFDDILDPFFLQPDTFVLDLDTGKISPNVELLSPVDQDLADKTIRRLKLDSPENNEMRARHYTLYMRGKWTEDLLDRYSPFVCYEAKRQGLL